MDPFLYPQCVFDRGICPDCWLTLALEDSKRIYDLPDDQRLAAWKTHDKKYDDGCAQPDDLEDSPFDDQDSADDDQDDDLSDMWWI
jgi:hypothetical protein